MKYYYCIYYTFLILSLLFISVSEGHRYVPCQQTEINICESHAGVRIIYKNEIYHFLSFFLIKKIILDISFVKKSKKRPWAIIFMNGSINFKIQT